MLQEKEGERAGGRSSTKGRAGSCTARRSLSWVQDCDLAGAARQAEPQSSQECSSKLLPCRAGCAGILKEAGLGMHGSLFQLL